MPATIRELTRAEIETFLRQHSVGRIAFTDGHRVDIEPISYAYAEGAIYGRAAPGTRMNALRGQPWVAFEVDDIRSQSDWESVVVKGTVYLVDPIDTMPLRAQYENAVRIVRTVMPGAFTPKDPVPERTLLFRLHIDEMEGRTTRAWMLEPSSGRIPA